MSDRAFGVEEGIRSSSGHCWELSVLIFGAFKETKLWKLLWTNKEMKIASKGHGVQE